MTRPIVWASGILISTVLSATSASEQVASLFGLGGSREKALFAAGAESGSRVVVSADLRGHFVVHPTLDGKRVRMLVDTGASFVALSHEDARLAGISVSARDYTRPISTANGIVAAASVRLAEVKVGDIAVRGVEALVLPPGKLSTSLLGMSFLKRLGGFEIAQGRLILKG
ncbi:MAG: TIGR02281 family clan AA aspartic protease [Microvirga sp.]